VDERTRIIMLNLFRKGLSIEDVKQELLNLKITVSGIEVYQFYQQYLHSGGYLPNTKNCATDLVKFPSSYCPPIGNGFMQ